MQNKNVSQILKSLKDESEDNRQSEILQKAIDDINHIDVSKMDDLNYIEKKMIRDGKFIRSVKEYSDRNQCGIRKAKIMCENYKNSLVKV